MIQKLLRNPITLERKPGYYVLSDRKYYNKKRGKWLQRNLGGPYKTEEEAKTRLQQVEMFKNMGR